MNTDVMVLCGGSGTRLRAVLPKGLPKALVDIDGKPFLQILLDHLEAAGFKRIILCTGYGARQIHDYVALDEKKIKLMLSFEGHQPRGTWPAILRASRYLESEPFLVINGDTYCALDYRALLREHMKSDALLTLAQDPTGVPVGTFVVRRALLALHPQPVPGTNLEDLILRATSNQVHGVVVGEPWYDIGTPAGLARFKAEYLSFRVGVMK